MDSEFHRRTVLPNGIRILTSAMPAARSASISLYVGTGSRYERDEEACQAALRTLGEILR